MHDPLDRLHRTKLALLAILLVSVGLGLLVLGHVVPDIAGWRWLRNWPIIDIGSGLFTTGLLGVALQYLDGQDSEVRDTERLRRVLAESAPAMRDAVISGFAFKPDDLARVATTETLDDIITNGLAIRLGDADFAREIYADLREQAIEVPERLSDARIQVRLSLLPAGSSTAKSRAELLAVTVRWEFTVVPKFATRRFVCMSDINEFRELQQDTTSTSAWYFKPKGDLTARDPEAFELVQFSVDGAARKIRRSEKSDSQTYTVNLGVDAVAAAQPVTVGYTYSTVTAVDGHLLRLRVDQPTRRLTIEMDYGDTELTNIDVADFFTNSKGARVIRMPATVPQKTITVELDGWVMPRSGLTFIW